MAFKSNRTATYELVPIQSDNEASDLRLAGTINFQPYSEAPKAPRIEVIFEKSLGTYRACVAGLICTWVVAAAAVGFGIYLISQIDDSTLSEDTLSQYYNVSHILSISISLALNVLVTALVESTGFIHAASLRWALQREGRLAFNSNLRLFTSSKSSMPNGRFFNALSLLCTILTYACSAFMFHGGTSVIAISGLPVLIFGLAFLGLASICTWALAKGNITTWSSSPLDTALACIHTGSLNWRSGRCMASVHEASILSGPFRPKVRQSSAWSAHKEVKRIIILLWALVLLCLVWAAILFLVLQFTSFGIAGNSWALIPNSGVTTLHCESGKYQECSTGTPVVYLSPLGVRLTILAQLVDLSIYSVIQAVVTLGLHCAELQVNLSRDEVFWRSAISKKGCKLSKYNSFVAAATSWQSIILFIFKAVIHWMFGLAASTFWGLSFGPVQIIYLAIVTLLFASFSTYISRRKPTGPQPATYGHLQSLVDLIDEWWPTMYWGHKSDGNPCHAGTSSQPLLQPILMDQDYASL